MKSNLVEHVNMRINLEDMKVLKEQAKKKRVPVSTLCRMELSKAIESYV